MPRERPAIKERSRDMVQTHRWRLAHPNRSAVGAVLALEQAEQTATGATLTLRQVSALLTHLRSAIQLATKPRKVRR